MQLLQQKNAGIVSQEVTSISLQLITEVKSSQITYGLKTNCCVRIIFGIKSECNTCCCRAINVQSHNCHCLVPVPQWRIIFLLISTAPPYGRCDFSQSLIQSTHSQTLLQVSTVIKPPISARLKLIFLGALPVIASMFGDHWCRQSKDKPKKVHLSTLSLEVEWKVKYPTFTTSVVSFTADGPTDCNPAAAPSDAAATSPQPSETRPSVGPPQQFLHSCRYSCSSFCSRYTSVAHNTTIHVNVTFQLLT